MSVVSYDTGDVFVYRVTKYLSTNPSNKWVNSYEAVAVAGGTETELLDLGTTLVLFETEIHHTAVVFDRLLISTWEPDSVPYNPSTFISSPLTAVGLRSVPATDYSPLGMCLDVRRETASGRFGHIFYRGVLFESDTSAVSGKAVLSDRPAMQTLVDDGLSDSGLEIFVGGGSTTLKICMKGGVEDEPRLVTQFRVGQVSLVKEDHKWFNRT